MSVSKWDVDVSYQQAVPDNQEAKAHAKGDGSEPDAETRVPFFQSEVVSYQHEEPDSIQDDLAVEFGLGVQAGEAVSVDEDHV